jgi:antitoxin (DNA-binding transcriptional repressor) of toxin-antitoxin stability system
MTKVSVEQAQATLHKLIHSLPPGEEVVLTEGGRVVARLTSAIAAASRKLGTLAGSVTYIAPDFDAPLDDFAGYMK